MAIPRVSLAPRDTSLPPDVHLEAGRLTVAFATPDNLLKLFLLAQKMADDFKDMCRKLFSVR